MLPSTCSNTPRSFSNAQLLQTPRTLLQKWWEPPNLKMAMAMAMASFVFREKGENERGENERVADSLRLKP